MKPFNLDEYHKKPSKPLMTRSGLNARIVCDDAPGDFPIIAIIDKMSMVDNCVTHVAYRKEGWINPDGRPSPYDLFFATEKHEGWVNVYKGKDDCQYYIGELFDSKEKALMIAEGYDNYITTEKIEWEE